MDAPGGSNVSGLWKVGGSWDGFSGGLYAYRGSSKLSAGCSAISVEKIEAVRFSELSSFRCCR